MNIEINQSITWSDFDAALIHIWWPHAWTFPRYRAHAYGISNWFRWPSVRDSIGKLCYALARIQSKRKSLLNGTISLVPVLCLVFDLIKKKAFFFLVELEEVIGCFHIFLLSDRLKAISTALSVAWNISRAVRSGCARVSVITPNFTEKLRAVVIIIIIIVII